jgi:hypothetical protein
MRRFVTIRTPAYAALFCVLVAGGCDIARVADVNRERRVLSLSVSPKSLAVQVDQNVPLSATVVLEDSSTSDSAAWSSANTAIASVSPDGMVTARAIGLTRVRAARGEMSDSAAITVTAAPPPPPPPPLPPPPPPGTSCLSEPGPLVTVSGVRTSQYNNTSLADNTRVDASTGQIMTTAVIGVVLAGGANVCYYRGEVLGYLPPSQDWSTMHDTYTFKVEVPGFVLEGARHFDYGDGVTIREVTSNWVLRGVYFKYMRDDCIENDFVNGGLIEDSFFDGCFQGFSSRPFRTTQDGSANVVTVRNSLFRLQHMDHGYTNPGHGGFFKWDAKGPMVSLHNNIYRVDEKSQHSSNHSFGPPAGKLKDCSNNVMIWLGSGPFPEQLPSCYRVLTGQEGLDYWNAAAAKWKADHPPVMPDVGRPIIAMFSPAATATLTGTVKLTATAVDDRDGLGVQFQLNGQNIGSLVTTESPLTKFSVTWDSRSMANGTYALTAVARDAAGNTRTAAAITVTISN